MFQSCRTRKQDRNSGKISDAQNAQNAHHNQTDDMIASAFKNMSIEERERNYHEMHGVADAIEETPEFVTKSLYDLEEEVLQIQRIDPKLAKTYQIAEQQDSKYVHNRLLRIRFLRAEAFIPKQSAVRMLRWFDWKRELFGDAKLCREIGYDDLMPEDIISMRKGYCQRLPVRDRAGRAIVVSIQDDQVYQSPESVGRLRFYMVMQRIEEPCETGEIVICMYTKQPSMAALDVKLTAMYAKASGCFPTRHVAFHHCTSYGSDILVKLFISSIMNNVDSQTRAKVKIHYGSFQEHTYSLMTYGLPSNAIPVTENGSIKTKAHLEWLKMRRVREKMAAEGRRDMIDLPLNSDVLLGRGKPIQQHMGNVRLQAIVDEYMLTYMQQQQHRRQHQHQHQSANKSKTALAAEIVKRVKDEAGSRFLSKEEGIWLEAPDKAAEDKVMRLIWRRKELVPSMTTVNSGQQTSPRSSTTTKPEEIMRSNNFRTPEAEAEMELFELQPAAKRWRM